MMVSDRCIFRESGWEVSDKWDSDLRAVDACGVKDSAGNLDRAKRRARNAVYDLAMCNDFRFFVTLTLDAARVDRYDVADITRKLNNWLDNHVRRCGLKYVLVPEFHKDRAVHFHGFFSDSLRAIDSGLLTNGSGKARKVRSAKQYEKLLAEGWHVIYNLPQWTLGFTTAIELYGDRRAAIGYVCKYVSKSSEKVGGRWYYSGGDLARPAVELFDVEYNDFLGVEGCHEFIIDSIGVRVVKLSLGGSYGVSSYHSGTV